MAHFGWGWGSPILGQLLPAYIHCGKWLWVHLCAGKEQLVSGGKAAQDVITPVPETALLAHFSVSARLPELLPPRHPRLLKRLSSQNGLLQNLSFEVVFLHKRKCYTILVHFGFLCVV